MNFHDLLNSSGEINSEFSFDVSLDYNSISSDLMTSDVFDSVFPLEETPISPELDNNSILDFENDDINMFNDTSLQVEEIYSPRSTVSISDSEKSSVYTESADESISSGANQSDDPLLACMNPSEIIKVVDTTNNNNSPLPIIKQNIKPTKIILQNPNNKKIVTKPFIHSSQLTPAPSNVKPKKIFKVHNITSNGRSVLLPLNLKSIKILNASDLKTENIKVTSSTSDVTNRKIEHYSPKSIEEEEIDGVSSTESQYPPLNLTNEEKRLLSKEGIQLPTHYPLTKNEERELKRIRRKIRNKISAQDSRKRKKEYVDGLEERVKRSSEEKKFLLQRIKQLQRQNNKLMSHFSKLQSLLFKSSTSKATPSTCVMVVLLSALLVSLPNIRLTQKEMSETEPSVRRSLLSSQVDEDLHMDEFLVFKDDIDLPQELIESENITEKELNKMVEYAEKGWKDKDSFFTVMMDQVNRWLGKRTVRNPKVMFDEPDIDEEPPLKRTCFGFDKLSSIGAKEDSVEVVTSFIIKDTEKK